MVYVFLKIIYLLFKLYTKQIHFLEYWRKTKTNPYYENDNVEV